MKSVDFCIYLSGLSGEARQKGREAAGVEGFLLTAGRVRGTVGWKPHRAGVLVLSGRGEARWMGGWVWVVRGTGWDGMASHGTRCGFGGYWMDGMGGRFELEIVGGVTDIADGDAPVRAPVSRVTRLAHSHHMAARLIARGLSLTQVSLQTGYSYGRLASLKEDPSFKELIVFYERDQQDLQGVVEERLLAVAEDIRQLIHERVLDGDVDGEKLTDLVEAAKMFYDRAGYAPVQRSVNKNVTLNIGARMDALKEKARG